MATTATLKIKCQETVHRVPLQEQQLNYEAILETVRKIHPGEAVAKYPDDEGDLCVLCAATFSDFLKLSSAAGGKTVLRLELFPGARAPSGAWKAEQAELGGASPMAAILEVVQRLKGSFKGKGKCMGERKGKGNCWGKSHGKGQGSSGAGAGEYGVAGHLREGQVASGFEESLNNSGGFEGMMHSATGGHASFCEWSAMCAPGPHQYGRASGVSGLGRALWQLYSADLVSARCVAAVVANSLGDLIVFVVEHAKAIDWTASARPEVTRQVMEVLLGHAVCAEGLEECAGRMEAAVAGEAIPVSEVLLGLLTALSELSHGARVSFLEALYTSQQEHVDGLLDKARPFLAMLPPLPAAHRHVACDGCDQVPLRGPRFRCTSLADYDLCARCFAEKDSAFGGRCAGHEFETITGAACLAAQGWRKGKGMCKGKGKQKGRHDGAAPEIGARSGREAGGEGGRRASAGARTGAEASDLGCQQQEPDPAGSADCDSQAIVAKGEGSREAGGAACLNAACGFQVTWHATHCCEMCKRTDGRGHGPRCSRVPVPGAENAAKEPPAPSAAPTDGKESSPGFDFSIPVALGDGDHASLEWNIGDDPQQVAEAFVARHGVLPEELTTVRCFVEQCVASVAQQPK